MTTRFPNGQLIVDNNTAEDFITRVEKSDAEKWLDSQSSRVLRKSRVFTIQCVRNDHVLAYVYATDHGRLLELRAAKLSESMRGRMTIHTMDSRNLRNNGSVGLRCRKRIGRTCVRMCVFLDELPDDVLMLAPLMLCPCSFSNTMSLRDLATARGRKRIPRSASVRLRRSNTVAEIEEYLSMHPTTEHHKSQYSHYLLRPAPDRRIPPEIHEQAVKLAEQGYSIPESLDNK